MIHKPLGAVEKADIESLISNSVLESKALEYKQELPGRTDSSKREFLADVSSFGNAVGGDIIFGIKAARDEAGKLTGAPEAVLPIAATADEAKLWLENVIRTGIAPRLPVQIREIAGFGDDEAGFVIVLRIPKSFASPHVVTLQGGFSFYSRNSAGKYQLDVHELRAAYLATESQADRIRSFRENRLGKVIADETPVRLMTPHRLVLHLVPMTPFLNNDRFDLSKLENIAALFPPFGGYGHRRYNLDGVVTHSTDVEDRRENARYCQLFFDGTIETVESDLVRSQGGGRPIDGKGGIASVSFEQDVIEAVTRYLSGYKQIGVVPPISISMSLLGCKGSFLYVNPRLSIYYHSNAIDRDVAILPDALIDSLDVNVPEIMRPIFDAVWNTCGFPKSFNYDETGAWNPR